MDMQDMQFEHDDLAPNKERDTLAVYRMIHHAAIFLKKLQYEARISQFNSSYLDVGKILRGNDIDIDEVSRKFIQAAEQATGALIKAETVDKVLGDFLVNHDDGEN